jgi:Ras homolog gene family, member A
LSLGTQLAPKPPLIPSSASTTSLDTLPAYTSTTALQSPPPYDLPKLRDLDQPFEFNIRMYNRHYRFSFSDTASPTSYTLLHPAFIILCYDISRRSTFDSLKAQWRSVVETHFNYDESLPVMVLGLKRDLRREWTAAEKESGTGCVMPQEGVRVASEMRCDRYAECSALTGELCREVFEDVARTACMTTTDKGGRSEGTPCSVM